MSAADRMAALKLSPLQRDVIAAFTEDHVTLPAEPSFLRRDDALVRSPGI